MNRGYDRICSMLAILALLMLPISSNLFGQSEIKQRLFQAVFEGDTLLAEELVQQGANPNSDYEGQALLFYAIENQDLDMVKFLFSRGADINKRNRERLSPLEFSLQEFENGEMEYPAVVVFLISNGANLKTKSKNTLLHRAADYGYPGSIVTALIENGADINAQDKERNTPLFYAMIYDHEEVALIISRYEPSLDFTLEIEDSITPLTYALAFLYSDELVESFIRHGADYDHQDEGFLSPFELAVERGFFRSLGAMLEKGADPDRLVEDLPLLIYVIEKEEIDTYDDTLLYGLIEQGANVNVEYEGKPLASYLIDASSSYKLDSIIFWNCNSEELELVTLDLLLSEAVRESDVKTLQKLISIGASINRKSDNDSPVLHSALWGCNFELIELLVEAGSDVNAKGYEGVTPLLELFIVIDEFSYGVEGEYIPPHYRPKIDSVELQRFPEKTIRLFVAHGANVNAKDADGYTPLTRAKDRYPQLSKLLIELGAVEEP